MCGNYEAGDIFYSDAKVCIYKLGFSIKGEKQTLIVEKKIKDLRYFSRLYFTGPYPVKESVLEVHQPEWLDMEAREFNFAGFGPKKTLEHKKGVQLITYSAKNLPAMRKEELMDGSSHIFPHLLLLHKSYTHKNQKKDVIANLDGLYAWYKHLVNEVKDDPGKVSAFARELTAKNTSDLDKIKSVYYWSQYHVRYIAFEEGIAGFQPEPAVKVMQQRFGDCKGKANLMKSMLQSLGFDARLAWVGTNHLVYDYSTPSLAVDNHMVCVLIHQKDTLVLDATEPFIALGDFAERLQGRQLLVEHGESYFIYKAPNLPASRNSVKHEVRLSLDGESLKGTAKSLFSGESKTGLLYVCNGVNNEATEKYLKNYLKSYSNQLQISKMEYSDLLDRENPFALNYSFNVKQALREFEGSWYLQLPLFQQNNLIEAKEDRVSAINMGEKVEHTEEYVISIPAGMVVSSLPASLSVQHEDFHLSLSYRVDGENILVRKEMHVPGGKIRKSSFEQWNSALVQLRKKTKEQIIFAKQ